MAYDGRAIANFVLDFCGQRGRPVTNLTLQKIVFFCHVWALIFLHRPLVKQKFEAWELGPVLPYLYRTFRRFDQLPIVKRATGLDAENGQSRIIQYDFDEETRALLEQVVDFYSRLTANDLVKLSHVAGGPWDKAWNHRGPVNPGMKIDDAQIAEFYAKVRLPFSIQ